MGGRCLGIDAAGVAAVGGQSIWPLGGARSEAARCALCPYACAPTKSQNVTEVSFGRWLGASHGRCGAGRGHERCRARRDPSSSPLCGARSAQRSAPRCWIHHEPGSGSNCWFRTCTTPRKRLCGAFFSCKPCFHSHTFAVEHFPPTFWMHQKRLWKRLLWCTGP